MKILLLNNPIFAAALKRLGHRVWLSAPFGQGDLWEEGPAPSLLDILRQLKAEDQPDLILAVESFKEKVYYRDLFRCPVPLVYYAIDTHTHLRWMRPYSQEFDLTLVAQRDDAQKLQTAHWLPLFYPKLDRPPWDRPRGLPVSFVGHLKAQECPERYQFYAELRQRLPILLHTGDYEDIFTRSRIVVNHSVAEDVNFRVFEAMACGAMLITTDVGNGLKNLFQPDHDLVIYHRGQIEEVVDLVQRYLDDASRCAAIARQGCLKVWRQHNVLHRAHTGLSLVKPLLERAKSLSDRPASGIAARHLAQRYLYIFQKGGGIYSRLDYLRAAEACLLQAAMADEDPQERAEVQALLGEVNLSGYLNLTRAEERYQHALDSVPDHYAALLGRGNIQKMRGDFEGALTWFLRAVATHPEESEGYHHAVLCQIVLSQWNEARALIHRAEAHGHQDQRLVELMSRIYGKSVHEDSAAKRRLLFGKFSPLGA